MVSGVKLKGKSESENNKKSDNLISEQIKVDKA